MKKLKSQLGFTMIELLIVITILGILAVAVLSAINPIEQINRGRDTGSVSDAEQLLGAADRYNAFQGHYPWQVNSDETDTSVNEDDVALEDANQADLPVAVLAGSPVIDLNSDEDDNETNAGANGDICPLLVRIGPSSADYGATMLNCNGADEIKQSFSTRLEDADNTRTLYIYNRGDQGDSTYVCFIPQSGAFLEKAQQRCANVAATSVGAGLPADIEASTASDGIVQAAEFLCGDNTGGNGVEVDGDNFFYCLP